MVVPVAVVVAVDDRVWQIASLIVNWFAAVTLAVALGRYIVGHFIPVILVVAFARQIGCRFAVVVLTVALVRQLVNQFIVVIIVVDPLARQIVNRFLAVFSFFATVGIVFTICLLVTLSSALSDFSLLAFLVLGETAASARFLSLVSAASWVAVHWGPSAVWFFG